MAFRKLEQANMLKKVLSRNWLIRKIENSFVLEAVQKYANAKLIDIGCGEKPYANAIRHYVSKHVGLDHKDTLHDKSKADLLGTAYNIPVPDEHFDTVLCTFVLEHLEEPDKAIKEAYRVLKTGSYAIYTVPLFWHLHEEPRDFYRYTKYGLKYLFEKNGFDVVELKPLSGFCVTFGQEFVYYLWRFRRGGKLNPLWWIIPVIGMLIQGTCYLLNKIDHSEEFTFDYLVIALKK